MSDGQHSLKHPVYYPHGGCDGLNAECSFRKQEGCLYKKKGLRSSRSSHWREACCVLEGPKPSREAFQGGQGTRTTGWKSPPWSSLPWKHPVEVDILPFPTWELTWTSPEIHKREWNYRKEPLVGHSDLHPFSNTRLNFSAIQLHSWRKIATPNPFIWLHFRIYFKWNHTMSGVFRQFKECMISSTTLSPLCCS